MDRSTVMCLVFFLGLWAHAVLVSAAAPETSPAFAWSNTGVFSKPETTTVVVVPSSDLSALAGDKTTSLSKYVTSDVSKAALLVLYVEDQLSTAQSQVLINDGSLSHVKSLLLESTSSLLAPTVFGVLSITAISSHLAPAASVAYVGQGDDDTMSLEQLLINAANPKSDLYTHGVTNLVIVSLHAKTAEEFVADDLLIHRIESAIGNVPHTSALVATHASAVPHVFERSNEHNMATFALRYSQELKDSTPTGLTPDGIVSGLVVMIPFVIIIAIAISCTCGLQSELRFEGEKVKKQ